MVFRWRYDIEVRGLEHVPQHQGMLLLANHPAELDPIVLTALLWKHLRPRPVVLMTFYRMAFARPFLDMCRAIPFSDLETERSVESVQQLKRALGDVVTFLRQGHNILLYPSGRLYRSGREVVGNASSTHLILSRTPDVPVLLIRTRGFWGSSFSCADGEKPDLVRAVVNGLWTLVRNGFFFCPRRRITIECEMAPPSLPRHADRRTINTWLEQWFNAPGDEPLTRVPHSWRQARRS